MNIKQYIREIPNWPKKGVNFKDITPLLQDKKAFRYTIDALAKPFIDRSHKQSRRADIVVGIDARGFIFASSVAYKLNAGLALIRKKGKLPSKTISTKYALEYASNEIEMHKDAITKGQKVLIVDDVLATGGTMQATVKLVEKLGGKIIGIAFVIDLTFLNGAKKLKKYFLHSLIKY